MTEGVLFAVVFLGFFVLRGIAATIAFYFLLPSDTRCPICDAETLHVHARWWQRSTPGFRPSWCHECGWHGMLRRSKVEPPVPTLPAAPRERPVSNTE